jgi:uncharacterized membrane protein
MAQVLRKTGTAVASGTRSLVPPVLAVALLVAGGLAVAVVGFIIESEPESGDETIAFAVMVGLTLVAVAVAWSGAVLALTLHFLGRHLGRAARPGGRDDPTD